MNVDGEGWKIYIYFERIQKCGRKHGNMVSMTQKEYVRMKESQRNESFADGMCWCKSKTDGKGRMFTRKRE